MTLNYRLFLLLFALVLAFYTRFAGLTRGESDFVSSELVVQGVDSSFYSFHPDEETLARAALKLSNPLAPPLTAYGMLPLYIWRGALELADLFADMDLHAFDQAKLQIYQVTRLLSIAISLATLLLVWYLGRQLYGDWAAALGIVFFAATPATTQLAHFATVDGLHTLLCLAAFALCLRALDRSRGFDYALAGLAIGMASAVRLNGLLMGLVLLVGYLLQRGNLRALGDTAPLDRRRCHAADADRPAALLSPRPGTALPRRLDRRPRLFAASRPRRDPAHLDAGRRAYRALFVLLDRFVSPGLRLAPDVGHSRRHRLCDLAAAKRVTAALLRAVFCASRHPAHQARALSAPLAAPALPASCRRLCPTYSRQKAFGDGAQQYPSSLYRLLRASLYQYLHHARQ